MKPHQPQIAMHFARLHKRLNVGYVNGLLGILSVVIFIVVVALLIIPYMVLKLLARYTPIGKVTVPLSS